MGHWGWAGPSCCPSSLSPSVEPLTGLAFPPLAVNTLGFPGAGLSAFHILGTFSDQELLRALCPSTPVGSGFIVPDCERGSLV